MNEADSSPERNCMTSEVSSSLISGELVVIWPHSWDKASSLGGGE